MAARARVSEAEAALADLPDLDTARAEVEDVRMTVAAARITMMSRRSAHDEVRREGEARTKRSQEITKEISGWRLRLETAEKRMGELVDRKAASQSELDVANAAPAEIAAARDRKLEEARSRRRLKASENQLAIAS